MTARTKQRAKPETPARKPGEMPARKPARRKPRQPDVTPERQPEETKTRPLTDGHARTDHASTVEPPQQPLAGGRLSAARRSSVTPPAVERSRNAKPHAIPPSGGLTAGDLSIAARVNAKPKTKAKGVGPVKLGGTVTKLALIAIDPAAGSGQVPAADGSGGYAWATPGAASVTKTAVLATGIAAGDIGAIATSAKGAASGVMGLDASGIGAQAPKAHGAAQHGRGGTDTMLNGLEVSDTSAQQANHTFLFGPRTATALTQPVPTLQPKTAALVCALDIAPSAGATAQSQNGLAWLDVCDGAVIDATTYNGTSVRPANGNTVTSISVVVGELSTRKFGTGTARPLVLASDWDGSSNPQIYMSPKTGANPSIVLGADGSDVLVGPLASTAIATTATKGFLHIPACAGLPTGTPHYGAAGAATMVWDSTNKKLSVYDFATTSWKQTAALT